MRVAVRRTGGNLPLAPPEIAGLVPRSTHVQADRADALFAIDRAGLYQIAFRGTPSTSGDYQFELSIAGDINGDGLVDGLDSQLLAAVQGTSEGQPSYVLAADLDGSGTIDRTDSQILIRNYGFVGNSAPVMKPASYLTHPELEIAIPLEELAADEDGASLLFRILAADHGAAAMSSDGRTVSFLPDPGFVGRAELQIVADDGFGYSAPATVTVDVSDAPLIHLDFQQREFRLDSGDVRMPTVLGDFADQAGVLLPASYLTFTSTNPAVVSVSSGGLVRAMAEGTSVLLVSSHGIQAASAVAVGISAEPVQRILYVLGLDVYPPALSLANGGESRPLTVGVAGQIELSQGSTGTGYYASNPTVVQVGADGLIAPLASGFATVTVINGPAEVVVPVRVEMPQSGPAIVGREGGVVQSPDGSYVLVAPDAVADTTVIDITTVSEEILPVAVPNWLEFVGAVRLEMGEANLAQPVQLAIPVSGAAAGTKVFVYRADSVPDETGNDVPIWMQVEVGTVTEGGVVVTTSPPYPGITVSGTYMFGLAPQQTGQVRGSVRAALALHRTACAAWRSTAAAGACLSPRPTTPHWAGDDPSCPTDISSSSTQSRIAKRTGSRSTRSWPGNTPTVWPPRTIPM